MQANKQKREKKTFEGLLSLVFGKRVALNDDAQLEVRMLVFFLFNINVGLYMICPMLMIVDLEFETKAKFLLLLVVFKYEV